MKQDGPHSQAEIRKAQFLPVVPAICAAIRPVLRTGVDHLWVLRMDGNGAYLSLLRQAVGEGLPVIVFHRPAEQPAKVLATDLGWHVCGASVNIRRCVRHSMSSLIKSQHAPACIGAW